MKQMLMYIGNKMQKQDAEAGNTSKKQAFIVWPPECYNVWLQGEKTLKKQQCALWLNAFSITYWPLGFWR